MATLPQETVRSYCLAQGNLQRWQILAASLANSAPTSRLRRFVDRSLNAAEKEYRAAERRVFDVFDIAASDLMTAGIMAPGAHRALLLERIGFHTRRSREAAAPEHADLHRRIARQLSAFIDETAGQPGI